MTPGPNYYYKCPSCGNILQNRSLMSGNTCGAVYFSDGRCDAPMLPDIPNLTKCNKCNKILWLSNLDIFGEDESWRSENPEWSNAQKVEHLELHDLWRALDDEQEPITKEQEMFVRQRIWRQYNRKYYSMRKFQSLEEIENWQENCIALYCLLDLDEDEQRCMAAELSRNLCNFSKCLELLKPLPEQYQNFKERLTEACKKRNPITIELTSPKKKILSEPYFDILQNTDGELLFCISEREGEPEDPEIVYAGGANALLYRTPKVIVLLDNIHVGAQEILAKKEKVLIAELPKGDKKGIVREYIANVNIDSELPNERGLEDLLSPKDEKDDFSAQITQMFAEKMKTDDTIAQEALEFYLPFAENCNAKAQYTLGKLYLDERFLDMQEAIRWLEYAAYQGHKEAIHQLEDLKNDDDGSYDAWV